MAAAGADLRSYSQYAQDLFLANELFKRKRDGVFVEIGAADGVALSNTKLFEDELGWTGLLIEPNPDEFEKLKVNRPRATCIQAAVFSEDVDLIEFRKITGYSMMLSGIEQSYDPRHIERIEREIGSIGGSFEIIQVPAKKFQTICAENRISHIDLLCIDVEGSELEILKGIPYDSVSIDVIMVEDNYNMVLDFIAFLVPKGYQLLGKIGGDLVFRHKSD